MKNVLLKVIFTACRNIEKMDIVQLHVGISTLNSNVHVMWCSPGGLPSLVHHLHSGLLHLSGLPHGGCGNTGIFPVSGQPF